MVAAETGALRLITLYAAMLVTLGFLLAALTAVVVLPAYRRRIERFTAESVRRVLPLTEDEIRADKDRMKAEYAMDVHKLNSKLDDAAIAAARQSVEINRRDARVHELEQTIADYQLRAEEHVNARRVLEQAILDRMPRVEQRLAEARKLLSERDADIALLAETSSKQTSALEEATQINVQQSEELFRLRAALDTRAARPREAIGDPRFDGEVALRTEIEMLRAKTRDQSALIARLQQSVGDAEKAAFAIEETDRLRMKLAKAEADLEDLQSGEDASDEARMKLEARIRDLEGERLDRLAELANLKGALQSYEDARGEEPGASGLSAKAEIAALQAELDQQKLTIQSLRADVASGNERLSRQAQHFRNELRRLGGAGAAPLPGAARRSDREPARLTLAERLATPRPAREALVTAAAAELQSSEVARASFLKAVNGGSEAAADDTEKEMPAPGERAGEVSPRRPRLLERLGGVDKSSS